MARIEALARAASRSWLLLLSVLIFVAVTLAGVKHVDFYGVGRATKLPLVDVAVPTHMFFYAAPVLTAAIYCHFHLLLIRLWKALGKAPPSIRGERLGDIVPPWLPIDAALILRAWWRKDDCISRHRLDWLAALIYLLLLWGFGLLVLFWLWWESMTARNFWMTSLAGFGLMIAAIHGVLSLGLLFRHVVGVGDFFTRLTAKGRGALLSGVIAFLILLLGGLRTHGPIDWLAPIDLSGEALVERPADWLPWALARAEYRAHWCRREGIRNCRKLTDAQAAAIEREWRAYRETRIDRLRKSGFNNNKIKRIPFKLQKTYDYIDFGTYDDHSDVIFGTYNDDKRKDDIKVYPFYDVKVDYTPTYTFGTTIGRISFLEIDECIPNYMFAISLNHFYIIDDKKDLRSSILKEAFIIGINLVLTNMQGADLRLAQAERADFRKALLQGADFRLAQAQGADFSGAQMQGASFCQAGMQEADLRKAKLNKADMREALLWRANFEEAVLEEADLRYAQLQQANLMKAKLSGTRLAGAQLQGANLAEAELFGADLSGAALLRVNLKNTALANAILDGALLAGTPGKVLVLSGTDLRSSRNHGGAVRNADMTGVKFDKSTDWRNAFLDASVKVPDAFRRQMGAPCQWRWAENANGGKPLTDEQFYGMWRGWIEAAPKGWDLNWQIVAPARWRHVRPIAPPPDCKWKPLPRQSSRTPFMGAVK